jgi:hypothetical protein
LQSLNLDDNGLKSIATERWQAIYGAIMKCQNLRIVGNYANFEAAIDIRKMPLIVNNRYCTTDSKPTDFQLKNRQILLTWTASIAMCLRENLPEIGVKKNY